MKIWQKHWEFSRESQVDIESRPNRSKATPIVQRKQRTSLFWQAKKFIFSFLINYGRHRDKSLYVHSTGDSTAAVEKCKKSFKHNSPPAETLLISCNNIYLRILRCTEDSVTAKYNFLNYFLLCFWLSVGAFI